MADTAQPARQARRPRRLVRRLAWLLLWVVLVSGAAALSARMLAGRALPVPDGITRQVEARLNAALTPARVAVGGAVLVVERGWVPRLHLRDVGVSDATGAEVARLNDATVRLAPDALLRGQVRLRAAQVTGAQMTLRRRTDGSFSLSFGGGAARNVSLPALLDGLDTALTTGPLAGLRRFNASALTLTMEDARSGRVWQVTDGLVRATRAAGDGGLDLRLGADVFNGTEDLAQVAVTLRTGAGEARATLGAEISGMPAQDLALQTPALGFLAVLDAPISARMRASVGADGEIRQVDGTLEVGAGALQPTQAARPVGFEAGKTYFTYEPDAQKLTFGEISVASDALRMRGEGHAYLRDFTGAWPGTWLGQFRLAEMVLAPAGMFEEPLRVQAGTADLKLTLDPFRIDLGEVTVSDGDGIVRLTGRIGADLEGWRVALDARADRITPERLVQVWPPRIAPGTRTWLRDNIAGGLLTGLDAALRRVPGARPTLAFDAGFEGARVRVLRDQPPIADGAGQLMLFDHRMVARLDDGSLTPPDGTPVSLAGTVVTIADTRQKPAPAQVDLRARGQLADAMRLLAAPPFRVLRDSDLPPDMAAADLALTSEVAFPLKRGLQLADVRFAADGTLRAVSSDVIVPGRDLAAQELQLSVTPQAVSVTGALTFDGLPADATWTLPLGAQAAPAKITARVTLDPATLDALGVALPPGSVTGAAPAALTITLPKDARPEYDLRSTLIGARLSVPELGWTKPSGRSGVLEVSGVLGARPTVDRVLLDAAGLRAEGRVLLDDDTRFEAAEITRLQVDNWLDASVTLRSRGPGAAPGLVLRGRALDLAGLPTGGGGGAGGQGGPLEVTLERLRITDSLSLTNFEGSFGPGARSPAGSFSGSVNGGTRVRGTLDGETGAIRVTADDAGRALSDAGLLENERGGTLTLALLPTGTGRYRGRLEIGRIRVRDVPAMASLLNAVSIVGLLDQLSGPGIFFEEVEADFRLSPGTLTIERSAAVGASMGLSLDGQVNLDAGSMALQGVVSPIYVLNGIGQVFTRRGEGLIGISFRADGPIDSPRVRVNPLSLLTPGMFREIFRRAPPSAPSGAPGVAPRQSGQPLPDLRGDDSQ